jgi:hypothetical protein
MFEVFLEARRRSQRLEGGGKNFKLGVLLIATLINCPQL